MRLELGPDRTKIKSSGGDPVPAGAVARLGRFASATPGRVTDTVVSPDGKWIASTTGRGSTFFFFKQKTAYEIPGGGVGSPRPFSPDGRRLASRTAGTDL